MVTGEMAPRARSLYTTSACSITLSESACADCLPTRFPDISDISHGGHLLNETLGSSGLMGKKKEKENGKPAAAESSGWPRARRAWRWGLPLVLGLLQGGIVAKHHRHTSGIHALPHPEHYPVSECAFYYSFYHEAPRERGAVRKQRNRSGTATVRRATRVGRGAWVAPSPPLGLRVTPRGCARPAVLPARRGGPDRGHAHGGAGHDQRPRAIQHLARGDQKGQRSQKKASQLHVSPRHI